jgi:hypothetical protein
MMAKFQKAKFQKVMWAGTAMFIAGLLCFVMQVQT